jgi:octaprenyl-diphosphate synthase
MLAAATTAGSPATVLPPRAEISPLWKHLVEPIEPFLRRVSTRLEEQVNAFEPEIATYARYALTNQGKQLRPALVALSAGAVGRLNDSHVTVAAIIEMVHLATLVHDDIIDEAQVRRGRPTGAVRWGNEISVLLGDCLFAQALKLAASFPTTEVCRAVSSATNTVCSGEILQTQRQRNFRLSRAEYLRMLEMKTAELFALSCDLGAFLADTSPPRRGDLRQYGLSLGTAYQIYDDCVDLYGSESAAGKSLGTDLAKGKLTLPVLLCLEQAGAADRRRLEKLIDDWHPENVGSVVQVVERFEALTRAKEIVHSYLAAARRSLTSLPPSESRSGLLELTDFLAQQADAVDVTS